MNALSPSFLLTFPITSPVVGSQPGFIPGVVRSDADNVEESEDWEHYLE